MEASLSDVRIQVSPDPAQQDKEVVVRVSAKGQKLGGWFIRVCGIRGDIQARAARIDAYAVAQTDGAYTVHNCQIQTMGYTAGDYMVDVSPTPEFELRNTCTKKFVVVPQDRIIATMKPKQ